MKYNYKWKYHIYNDGSKSLEIDLGPELKVVNEFLISELSGGLISFAHRIEMMERNRKDAGSPNKIGGNAIVCEMLGDKIRLIDAFAAEEFEMELLELYRLMSIWVSGKYLHDEKGYKLDQLP